MDTKPSDSSTHMTGITSGMTNNTELNQSQDLNILINKEFEGKGVNHAVTPEQNPELFAALRDKFLADLPK